MSLTTLSWSFLVLALTSMTGSDVNSTLGMLSTKQPSLLLHAAPSMNRPWIAQCVTEQLVHATCIHIRLVTGAVLYGAIAGTSKGTNNNSRRRSNLLNLRGIARPKQQS
eukprot:15913-Heterococcus_DN1.PRE.1